MVDVEVLKLALSKEEEAIKLYSDLIPGHPNLQELLYFLISEEHKHKALIEKKIVDLTHY